MNEEFKPQRILCVCQGGNVRSVTLRFLLNYKYGADALACGWEPNTDETKRMLYDWAEIIVVMQEEFRDLLPEDVRHKVTVVDVGPDRWGRSLDPDLIQVIEDAIQSYMQPAEAMTS